MLKEELQKRDAEAGNQQDQLAKMIAEMESSFKYSKELTTLSQK